jgi:CHRD domain
VRRLVKGYPVKLVLAVAVVAVVGWASVAMAGGDTRKFSTNLTGFEEVPALSTPGAGDFRARLNRDATVLQYELRYSALESQVTQAHIHFENATNNGGIVVFLCSNLGNGPAGTPMCPPAGTTTVTGTLTAAQVVDGAAMQGIAAGEFNELVRALRAGATYVNVHSTGRMAGEIRGQLDDHSDGDRHHW